jgi:hypothetical protein
VAAAVDPQHLDDSAGQADWTAGQILGHLAEFPHFFAAEIRRYLADRAAVIGRTHDHPGRVAAVDRAGIAARDQPELLGAAQEAFADLAEALARLGDGDLDAPTRNVRYGDEPLRAFLDRYVIGHKAGHLQQLRDSGGSK